MIRTTVASLAALALSLAGCASAVRVAPADTGSEVVSDSGADAETDSASDVGSDGGLAAACVASGGTVGTASCCASSSDFPNTCAIGACGCAPSSSHPVQVCNCPATKCWNGSTCSP